MNNLKLLDGAIGSELILRGQKLPPYIWSADTNLTSPNLLLDIHRQYVESGANYITANTFRATPRSYKKTGLSSDEANYISQKSMQSAIKIAKNASDEFIKVLGSIAPLEDCYSPQLFPGVDVAKKEFSIIAQWLEDGAVDGYLLETMNNIPETKSCLEVIRGSSLPVWISFNLKDSNCLQSGETLEDAINMSSNFDVECILLNCNPINRTQNALEILSESCSIWGIYPNLGIGEPSPNGVINSYHSDIEFLDLCKKALELGASVLGGCCGTSPQHIKLLKDNFLG